MQEKSSKEIKYSTKNEILDATLADEDGILLLENVKTKNYVNADRYTGLDKQETFVVLQVSFYGYFQCRFK